MLRWLLPLIAALALLGSSVMAWAAAGSFGDPTCCCPDKAKCKCHDHDGEHAPDPILKKCGGEGRIVAPVEVIAVETAPAVVLVVRVLSPVVALPPPLHASQAIVEIETPPF